MTPAHHVLGAVVEMIHTATLVHDDVLDSASVRRHVSTVNAGWGNQTSILLGDYLFTKAFHLASSLDNVLACRIIGEATNRVCEENCSKAWSAASRPLRRGVSRRHRRQDRRPHRLLLPLGCALQRCDRSGRPGLARFGRHLGLAFQIAMTCSISSAMKGKPANRSDRRRTKKLTLPLIRLLRQSPAETASKCAHILRTSGNHKTRGIASLLHQTDALGYAKARAEESASQARAELSCLAPSPYRLMLETLTRSAVERNR